MGRQHRLDLGRQLDGRLLRRDDRCEAVIAERGGVLEEQREVLADVAPRPCWLPCASRRLLEREPSPAYRWLSTVVNREPAADIASDVGGRMPRRSFSIARNRESGFVLPR